MLKLYPRIVQAGVKLFFGFLNWRIPEVIEGQGGIIKIPEILSEKHGLKRPLLMVSKTVERSGLLDQMFIDMKEKGIEYAIYDEVAPNPTEINVEEALEIYLKNKCDSLIAIGGGSPIDCCKVVGARVVNPDKTVAQMMGMKVKKKIPLMIAVPTTSGTGSETTMYAVITDSKTHHKGGIADLAILPDYAVLDPELMVGLPPYLTAISGMDALSHAVECYTNYKYLTDLEKEHAKKAVKLIYENLYEAYKDGGSTERRLNMQKAAFDAGVAFNRGMTGYVHSIGHTLGGLYNVPHGLAMAVILPVVMKQYGASVYKRLSELADVCGIKGNSEKEKAEKFISWIENLNEKMGIPKTFDIIQEKDIPQMIKWAKADGLINPTPQVWNNSEFEKCIRKLIEKKGGN